ncbi:MAG: winged helix DNA-binding protein [Bacteroides sp.]|nr:winged helix DNA-binding protein [Roseburia sp.]MCM1345658.1 winged helix DNA-binding protein [Bacteroides sp.]MCM1419893.1 winged helix DNA-binding protein [Bacteroides sp.]
MEKIKSICVMRELLKAMNALESQLQSRFGVSINEAMALCCIGGDTLTASKISENIGLTPSNTSKVIRSIESKELVTRSPGDTDHRQMCFTLTEKGMEKLRTIKNNEIEIPEFIKPLFDCEH